MPTSFKQVFPDTISGVTTTAEGLMGQVRYHDQDQYVYAYNAGAGEVAPGYAVGFATGATGYSVSVTALTGGTQLIAGVVQNATLVTAGYGYILTKGFATIEATDSSMAAAGVNLSVQTSGGWGTATTGQYVNGITLAAIATGASGQAFVNVGGFAVVPSA